MPGDVHHAATTQWIVWGDTEDNNKCVFCHNELRERKAFKKHLDDPDAPVCVMCRKCSEEQDFSNWEDVDNV